MIVYHLCRARDVPQILMEGLVRSEGRHFVFDRWQDAQLLLGAVQRDSLAGREAREHVALVLDVEEDMLATAPVPARKLPAGMRPEDVRELQGRSRFFEVDLNPKRIVDIKDALGDSIVGRFRRQDRGRAPVWRFLGYARPYWPLVAAATCAGFAKFLLPLAFPWMLKVLLDEVVLAEGIDAAVREREILRLILAILAANVVWMIATYYRGVLAAIAGHRMIRDLRVALFSHVQRLSHAFFARHQTGAIVSRLVSDISLAQNFVGSALTNVWMDIVLLIALVVILTLIHPMMTLVSLALMPVYVYALHAIGPRIRLSSKEVQQRLEVLSGGLQEKVAGVSIVKGFVREGQETQIFASHANKLLNRILYSARFSAWNEVVVGFVVHSAPVLVVWFGVHQILAGRLTVGELTQFLLYLGMFYFPLQRLSDLSVVLANSLAAIDRIFEYFDTQPHVNERPDAVRLTECQGRIEFEDVAFGYDADAATLRDIRLVIAPGQTVAVVGPSGAGKSTLANLVPRFYDPTSGRILLDGHDLRDLEPRLAAPAHRHREPGDGPLLGHGAGEPAAREARRHARGGARGARGGERARVRGAPARGALDRDRRARRDALRGQKQRLAIARAFLKDPRILILDEATSSLDSRAERHIQQALARLLQNRTSIVIAHRLSTILRADQIVVMEGGRIVDAGRHAELLARGGLYAQLYHEQFGQLDLPRAG